MPIAALSLLLMPFGLEGWALAGDGLGLRRAAVGRALGRGLARRHRGAACDADACPADCWRSACCGWAWRAAAGAGSARRRSPPRSSSAWIVPRPDVLISPSGKLVAFRTPDGDLILSSNRAERLVRETWLRRNGQIRFDDIGDLDGSEESGCAAMRRRATMRGRDRACVVSEPKRRRTAASLS